MNPTQLGRFQIERELGKGAMGQVYLANDPKIDRKVAIKTVVPPAGSSEADIRETSERFQREAQAAGKLLHPGIVTIFDVGEDGGIPFIAMEYIEGETLDSYARPGNLLPLGRVLDLVAQTAAALDYAHANRVVHRDIKPANLMVLKDGTLKVTDFGLAKNPQANLTQTGVLLGTPSYMSPEQIQGAELDGRSDLFSLGVVLYELLTGVRPFDADAISTIIYRILYEDPRPPAAHNPALPPDVNVIIERALAKDPDRRYATGADLVADLHKAFASLPEASLSQPMPGSPPAGVGQAAAAMRASRLSGPTIRRDRGRPRPATGPGSRRGVASREPRRNAASGSAPPRPTLIAHHPVKLTALFATLVVALVVFPRWANRHEPAVRSASGITHLGGAGDVVSTAALGGGPRQVVIDVETIPHGATISLDSIPLAEPRLVLSLADSQPHDIAARAGCMQAVAEMTAGDLASFEGPLVMELSPRREEVRIVSDPPGASIRLNGNNTRKVTPAQITLDGCEENAIALERKGYRSWKRTYNSDDDFEQLADALQQVVLEPIPKGTVLVKKTRDYDVAIFAGGKQIGQAGKPFNMTEGRYNLTFRNEDLFVNESAPVRVIGGKTVTPEITLPQLGRLTVQASPSNCKVYVDGKYVDVTPVLNLKLASGSHRVKVVYVPNGSTREETVTVEGDKDARVLVKF